MGKARLKGCLAHHPARREDRAGGREWGGKTTFVKLLMRPYDLGEGQVLFDGIDLRKVDPKDLQKRIGVIFRDLVRYVLPARESIGVGQIDQLDNEPPILFTVQAEGYRLE